MMATLNEGDEVIVPAPYWVSYPDIVLLAGGKPVVMECNEKQGFKINSADLEKFITPKTKWIILNSPSNPTGACYTEKEIREIAKAPVKTGEKSSRSETNETDCGSLTKAKTKPENPRIRKTFRRVKINWIDSLAAREVAWKYAREKIKEHAKILSGKLPRLTLR